MKRISCAVVLLFTVACASAPPNLSKQGTQAFYAMKVIKGLDLLRDIAISANAQVPPLLSEATTRKVVLFHKSALNTIVAVPSGWKDSVLVGLDEVLKNLPSNEQQQLAPYVALVKTVIQEVTSGPQALSSRNRGSSASNLDVQGPVCQKESGRFGADRRTSHQRLQPGIRVLFGQGRAVAGGASGSGFGVIAIAS